MKFTYTLNRAELADYYDAVTPFSPENPLYYYLWMAVTYGLILGFAWYAMATSYDLVWLAIMCFMWAVYNLRASIPYSRSVRRGIQIAIGKHQFYECVVEITEEGVTQTQCDIRTFNPWSSLRSVQLRKEIILVEIAPKIHGFLPRRAAALVNMTPEQLAQYFSDRIPKTEVLVGS